MSFNNKVVIVTGASSGNGASFAYNFAKNGAKVALVGRNEVNLKATAEKCQNVGGVTLVIVADLSKDEETKTIVEKTIKRFGKLDVLVNGAGMLSTQGSLLDGHAMSVYDSMIAVHLRAAVHLTSLAAPYLKITKGNIVNVSSIASVKMPSKPGRLGYYIAKAGLNHFTKCAALELAPFGVRVNATMCGIVRTNILANLGLTGEEANFDNLTPYTALNRVSDADEIAEVVLFLASDKAKSVTGSLYTCDNGIGIKSPPQIN